MRVIITLRTGQREELMDIAEAKERLTLSPLCPPCLRGFPPAL